MTVDEFADQIGPLAKKYAADYKQECESGNMTPRRATEMTDWLSDMIFYLKFQALPQDVQERAKRMNKLEIKLQEVDQ